jgi:tetratricopeptide (TPR) repeat protein
VSALDSVRKEHVVFGGTAIVLAALYFMGAPASRATSRGGKNSGEPPKFEEFRTPDTSVALPRARALEQLDRDVFSQPTDTRPLPPLELQLPPLPPLAALRPPATPALDARLYGKLLRSEVNPVAPPVSGLFFSEETGGDAESELEELSSGQGASLLELLETAAAGAPRAPVDESPEERAERLASYAKLYDSLRLGETETLFGQIRNPDRFALQQRPEEAVLFVQIDPFTGKEKFPGQKPVAYARDRVRDFAFADTVANRINVRRRALSGAIGASQYAELLALAHECIDARFEAREALAIAEELFQRAQSVDPQDPAASLGLGRCYEAGFQFDKAFAVYTDLLTRLDHRPEVHVALAELEARVRLFDSARERFLAAESRGGKASWRVQRAFGRFLFEAGEYDEALPHLRAAFENEPREANQARTRAAIRTEFASGLLAVGSIDEAAAMFEKALQAEPGTPHAIAGRLQCQRLGASAAKSLGGEQAANFDLLMARALLELEARNWTAARDALALAAGADPLRASQAWRAMSWLAELTGNGEEALRWIERAREADPTDPWVLFQHGRLLAQREDYAAAREAFVAALDRELDFPDALAALGELSLRTGDGASAERYFERALSLDDKRAEVHALRSINLLVLGDRDGAREAFEAALAVDALQPLARVAQAWHTYRGGDTQKAITQFAELNDVRRSLPESEPFRAFARGQMERIAEHETLFQWSDVFERSQLKNGWETEESAGPTVTLQEGALRIDGVFSQNGAVRVFQEYNAAEFVSFEADVTVATDSNAKVGVFLSKERRAGAGGLQTQSKIGIARRRDGGLVVLVMDTATADENWEDVPAAGAAWWPAGRTVRLRIERVGEGNLATGRLLIDGVPIREGIKLPRLSAASGAPVRVGVFVEGQTGLPGKVTLDNVDVIRRIKR